MELIKSMSAKKLYIANTGMVTPLGGNTLMSVAAVNADISAYALSDYESANGKPLSMAQVPDELFDKMSAELDEGDRFNLRHDRMTKMAILSLAQACAEHQVEQPVPMVMSMPDASLEAQAQWVNEGLGSLIQSLGMNVAPWVDSRVSRSVHSGRAGGIEALELIFNYLFGPENNYVLLGGTDSYLDDNLLRVLEEKERLLFAGCKNGFAPGEAAGFLLLTPHPELALEKNGHIIALHFPGIAEEHGHLYSEKPYCGDGLDRAFKKALINYQKKNIHSLYSSMNGEHFWAKEMGVALMRNRASLGENIKVEHFADCYGDLGAATAPVLIAMAAENLLNDHIAQAHLVYSSSDTAMRGAVVVEKLPVASAAADNE